MAAPDTSNTRELLDEIRPPVGAISQEPDPKTRQESQDLEREHKRTVIGGLQQDITERKKYAGRAFWLVAVWLAMIGGVVILEGFKIKGFNLGSGVLMTLIGSTTTGVVGLFYIVTKYLFHYDDPSK